MSTFVPGGAQLVTAADDARGLLNEGATIARQVKNTAKKVKTGAHQVIEKKRKRITPEDEGNGVWEAPDSES